MVWVWGFLVVAQGRANKQQGVWWLREGATFGRILNPNM